MDGADGADARPPGGLARADGWIDGDGSHRRLADGSDGAVAVVAGERRVGAPSRRRSRGVPVPGNRFLANVVVPPLARVMREALLRHDHSRAAAAASLVLTAVRHDRAGERPGGESAGVGGRRDRRSAQQVQFGPAERDALHAAMEVMRASRGGGWEPEPGGDEIDGVGGSGRVGDADGGGGRGGAFTAADEVRARELARQLSRRGAAENEADLHELAVLHLTLRGDPDRAVAEVSRVERLAVGRGGPGYTTTQTPERRRFVAMSAHHAWLVAGGLDAARKDDDANNDAAPLLPFPGVHAERKTKTGGRGSNGREGGSRGGRAGAGAELRRLAEAATDALAAAAADAPGDPIVAAARAQMRLAVGDLVGARDAIAEAAAVAPDDVDAQAMLADVRAAMARAADEAEADAAAAEVAADVSSDEESGGGRSLPRQRRGEAMGSGAAARRRREALVSAEAARRIAPSPHEVAAAHLAVLRCDPSSTNALAGLVRAYADAAKAEAAEEAMRGAEGDAADGGGRHVGAPRFATARAVLDALAARVEMRPAEAASWWGLALALTGDPSLAALPDGVRARRVDTTASSSSSSSEDASSDGDAQTPESGARGDPVVRALSSLGAAVGCQADVTAVFGGGAAGSGAGGCRLAWWPKCLLARHLLGRHAASEKTRGGVSFDDAALRPSDAELLAAQAVCVAALATADGFGRAAAARLAAHRRAMRRHVGEQTSDAVSTQRESTPTRAAAAAAKRARERGLSVAVSVPSSAGPLAAYEVVGTHSEEMTEEMTEVTSVGARVATGGGATADVAASFADLKATTAARRAVAPEWHARERLASPLTQKKPSPPPVIELGKRPPTLPSALPYLALPAVPAPAAAPSSKVVHAPTTTPLPRGRGRPPKRSPGAEDDVVADVADPEVFVPPVAVAMAEDGEPAKRRRREARDARSELPRYVTVVASSIFGGADGGGPLRATPLEGPWRPVLVPPPAGAVLKLPLPGPDGGGGEPTVNGTAHWALPADLYGAPPSATDRGEKVSEYERRRRYLLHKQAREARFGRELSSKDKERLAKFQKRAERREAAKAKKKEAIETRHASRQDERRDDANAWLVNVPRELGGREIERALQREERLRAANQAVAEAEAEAATAKAEAETASAAVTEAERVLEATRREAEREVDAKDDVPLAGLVPMERKKGRPRKTEIAKAEAAVEKAKTAARVAARAAASKAKKAAAAASKVASKAKKAAAAVAPTDAAANGNDESVGVAATLLNRRNEIFENQLKALRGMKARGEALSRVNAQRLTRLEEWRKRQRRATSQRNARIAARRQRERAKGMVEAVKFHCSNPENINKDAWCAACRANAAPNVAKKSKRECGTDIAPEWCELKPPDDVFHGGAARPREGRVGLTTVTTTGPTLARPTDPILYSRTKTGLRAVRRCRGCTHSGSSSAALCGTMQAPRCCLRSPDLFLADANRAPAATAHGSLSVVKAAADGYGEGERVADTNALAVASFDAPAGNRIFPVRMNPSMRCRHCRGRGVLTKHCGTVKAPKRCERLPKGGRKNAPKPDGNAIVLRCAACRAARLGDGLCGTALASATCHVLHGKPVRGKEDNRCKACFYARASIAKCSTKAAPTFCLFVSRHAEPCAEGGTGLATVMTGTDE